MKSKNIILLHGWGTSTQKLEPLTKYLEKTGWNVIVPPLAGFDAPPPDAPWGVQEYSDHVREEAKKAFKGKKYFLFGHSFGGRVAIKLAAVNESSLSGVILCAAGGLSRGSLLKRTLFATLAKTGQAVLIIPGTYKIFRKLLYKAAREHDYEKTKGIMKDVFKKVVAEDLRPLVAKISLPVLVLWGRQDKMTPVTDAMYLASNLKKGTLKLFDDIGHKLPYDRPLEISKSINTWYKSLH